MVEPTTIGISVVAAYLSKDGISKLLGPTADYLGEGLRAFAEKRAQNINSIFIVAQKKLKSGIELPGLVSPKVLNRIVNEGSYSSDKIAIEYLGGVLASSRTESGRDDRGAGFAQLVNTLSSFQLRTHYLIYSTLRTLFENSDLSLNMHDRPKLRFTMPFGTFIEAMDFSEQEKEILEELLSHIFFGLVKEGLIGPIFQYGPKEELAKGGFPQANLDGIIVEPSVLGVQLYLWAFGLGNKTSASIFSTELETSIEQIPISVRESLKLD